MLNKISDRIYFLPPDDTTDRPALGYILGDTAAMMIDCGNSKKHAVLFLGELKKAGLPYPTYAAITHWHWDHTFGMCAVPARIIACAATNEKLAAMQKWQWTDEAMARRIATGEDIEFCDTNIKREYPDRSQICVKTADIIFKGDFTVDLGGVKCVLRNVENSHSPDCVIVLAAEQRVAFMGDILCEDMHNGEPHYYPDKLAALLAAVSDMEFDTAVLGHDPEPCAKAELIEYLQGEYSHE